MRVVGGLSGSALGCGIAVLAIILVAAPVSAAWTGHSVARASIVPRGPVPLSAGNLAPPHFDNGYDANGNGLFDFLLVNVSIQVTAPGDFYLSGFLHDANYTLSISHLNSTTLPVGPAIVTMWFEGPLINKSGVDGPYTVDLILFDANFSFLDSGSHITQPYSHLDFDPIPALLAPPHSDFGRDTNGNGLFDTLNVQVNIQVNVADTYAISAILSAGNSSLVLVNTTSGYLPVGPGNLTVSFPGGPINQSGVDGPYTVNLALAQNFSLLVDSGTHITQPYSHLDFDPIAAFMTPPHSDFGQDTNGNGLFDSLNVNVSVQVNLADTYGVAGFLHNANFSLTVFSSATGFLPVGPGILTVSFAGGPINQSGVDGPYIVELDLYQVSTSQLLGYNTTVTQAYSHLSFDGPAPVAPIQSSAATTIPTIDGLLSAGEWNDSTLVNLTAISGNTLPANLYVKNNATMLYIAYDAVGDLTAGTGDAASISFDTGNDNVASDGHEDQFVEGGFGGNPSNQSHWVYSSATGGWVLHDAPYNPSLPNEAGLASAWGFGPSPNESANHRVYEFAIPLALLGATPNDTLGFFGGSYPSPGVVDWPSFHYSLWPIFAPGPIPLASYGDLILAGAGGGDTTPPSLAINSPSPGELIPVDSIILNWSASDAGSGLDHFELRTDGGPPVILAANVTGYTVTVSSDGPHTIQVTAFDAAGNSASDSVTATVDTTPPTLAIDTPAPGAAFAVTTVATTWNASDATSGVDHFELSLDSGPARVLPRNAQNYTFGNLSEGSHTISLVAFDLAGHTTTATRTFVVDLTAPTVTIDAPTPGWLSTRNVLVTWTAADSGSGVVRIEVSLDGGSPVVLAGTATSTTLTGVADGPHTITVQVFDAAGSAASDSVSVTVDATAPIVSLTSPASGQFLGTSSVQLIWTASDASSGIDHFEVSVDGGTALTLPNGTTTHTFTGVSDGSHTFRLQAFDVAGNSGTATVTVTVDVTAPTLSITAPAAAAFVSSHSLAVTWTATDATSGIDHYTISIDGGSGQTIAGTATSHTFSGVSDGPHTIALSVVDRAGNTRSSSIAVTVDTTAPTVSIVTPSEGAVIPSASSTVSWTASDSSSGLDHVTVRVDGGASQTLPAGTTSTTLSGLADGGHTVNVTVVDRAGNSMSQTVSFRTDTSFVSPSGPYGVVGLTSIILVIGAIIAAIAILRRRRSRKPQRP